MELEKFEKDKKIMKLREQIEQINRAASVKDKFMIVSLVFEDGGCNEINRVVIPTEARENFLSHIRQISFQLSKELEQQFYCL